MTDIAKLHHGLHVASERADSLDSVYTCDFLGQPLELSVPQEDMVSGETDFIDRFQYGPDEHRVNTLYMPNEEGPCGGVNMAELVLDKLIDYRDMTDPLPYDIFGNHPPSKGAERAALYRNFGVDFDRPIDQIDPGNVYLFSAHGADPREVARAQEQGLYVVDTTCPLVDRIYHHIRKAQKPGESGQVVPPEATAVIYLAPLYKRDHPEVAGTRGVAETAGFRFVPVVNEQQSLDLVAGADGVGPEQMSLDGITRVMVTGLTTNNAKEVLDIGNAVSEAASNDYETIPYSERDVCRTVQYRQEAIEEVVGKDLVDEVIVLGAVGSNNTNELVRKVLATSADRGQGERRLRRITFANVYEQIPLSISGDALLMSGASTILRNVTRAKKFLNPRKVVRVGRKENRELFVPLGKGSLARRILDDDFSWLEDRVEVSA